MTPLETARKALGDAENRLDELTAQRDDYARQLSEAERAESEGRRKRIPVAKLAELMRVTQAAAAYVADVEGEQAAIRDQLPGLEATLEREALLSDFGATADAGTKAADELRAALGELGNLIRPHVGRFTELHTQLEAAREGYGTVRTHAGADAPALEAEAARRGHDLQAVSTRLSAPPGDDLATRVAFGLIQAIAGRHAAARAEAAQQVERERQAAAAARREQAERDAEPRAFAILERPDEALAALGSLVIGSQSRPQNARFGPHTEIYVTRGNVGRVIDTLKRLGISNQPLGEPRA